LNVDKPMGGDQHEDDAGRGHAQDRDGHQADSGVSQAPLRRISNARFKVPLRSTGGCAVY
jgi:hypothetical protein